MKGARGSPRGSPANAQRVKTIARLYTHAYKTFGPLKSGSVLLFRAHHVLGGRPSHLATAVCAATPSPILTTLTSHGARRPTANPGRAGE